MLGLDEKVLQPESSPAEERRVSMKKQRESDANVRFRVKTRNQRLAGRLRAEQCIGEVVLRRRAFGGKPLVVGKRAHEPMEGFEVGRPGSRDSNRTPVRLDRRTLLRAHNGTGASIIALPVCGLFGTVSRASSRSRNTGVAADRLDRPFARA